MPSLSIPLYDPLGIICDADVAPNPSNPLTNPPEPPVRIMIHIGIYKVKECTNGGNPVNQCEYNFGSFFPGIPRLVSCTAEDKNGGCRFRTAQLTISPPTGGMLIIVINALFS